MTLWVSFNATRDQNCNACFILIKKKVLFKISHFQLKNYLLPEEKPTENITFIKFVPLCVLATKFNDL